MPTIEIDEAELANYRQVTNTMSALLNSPKTRRQILSAVKTINPNASIPELDAAEPYAAQITEIGKKVDEFITETRKSKQEEEEKMRLGELRSEWNAGKNELSSKGYTPEAITAIEKLMEERGIRSHADAAVLFDAANPQPAAIATGRRYINEVLDPEARKDNEFLKVLFEGDSEGALNGMINQAISDVRKGVAA